ncbi:hypothetical protein [Piscinibacter sp.]|uniref:hypothetical protein n=1 Tax=Piscinibacter sp. TaxID=1903157 RepID=UPI0039E658C0
MRAAACLALALAAALPAHGAGPEQVVGGIDAVLFVCTPLDAKSVRPGQELLQRAVERHKLDLAAIRKSEPYRAAYNAEVNRLLGLPPRERLAACQSAW